MSCPICGEFCRCAEPRSYESKRIILADVDEFEDTEEQFASSVAGMERQEEQDDREQELASGSLVSARQRHSAQATQEEVAAPSAQDPESWRDEVASRLQNYKARRRRDLGDESLSFNFESTTANHVFLRPEVPPETDLSSVSEETDTPPYYAHNLATAPAYNEPEVPEPMDHTSPETQSSFPEFEQPVEGPKPAPDTAKLIVFPRAPIPQEPPRDQLADPVFDKPRIVEATGEAMQTFAVPLADITLKPEISDDVYFPNLDEKPGLPVQVASRAQRLFGELVDVLLVIVATGLFATVISKIDPTLLGQDKKTMFALAVMVPSMFWSVYKYLFLVYHGSTVGMQLARMQLVELDGSYPTQGRRRSRALAMLVSIFPLGLGLMWSFVDEDELCWHDRISRTYLIAKASGRQDF
jgi:hypothetical protein